MVKTHTELTVKQLLTEDDYAVPLYQRNFAWSYDEIAQLLNDIADAYQEKRENYYTGTLVASQKEDWLEIIDGQQRITVLTLISLALRNMGLPLPFDWDSLRLQFPARRKSQENLEMIFQNRILEIEEENENEITLGYRRTQEALKTVLAERKLESDGNFINYLFKNVLIFRSVLPSNLDLNLYFERFNSRGEQLEAHEIIKAQMMAKFGDDQIMAGRFAKIWDACADFDKPVILAFQKKAKHTNDDLEREKIFPVEWVGYYSFQNKFQTKLDSKLSQVAVRSEKKQSLLKVLENENQESKPVATFHDDESVNYSTVVNFETFLYYAYYLTFGNTSPKDIQLDDKKLLATFQTVTDTSGSEEDVISFIQNLLKLKFIFDNLIVRMSQETIGEGRRKENEWFLQKVHRNDVNQKSRGHRYVQYRFDKNSFEKYNEDILMLQSMFAVTFTANSDSRWLYETLQFLFEHVEELHQEEFGEQFKDFLEDMAVRYAQNRIFNEDGSIKSYLEKIPIYAFNFIDYVLWKNREDLKKDYKNVKFGEFKFTYRRSIEHWYPQNPIGEHEEKRFDDKDLHSIGNLCIITDSQNSKFSNLVPKAKYDSWEKIFPNQSLKLQMMAQETKKKKKWDEESIAEMEETITEILKKYRKSE